jgi:glycosyltransferase involved in cell wall biosynthesis
LRVVQVLGGAEDGGLEKHTIELAHSLRKKGVDVSVIAHKKFKNDFGDLNFIECDLSRGRNNPLALFQLYKILKQNSFDIIHAQANKATDMVIKLKPFLNSKIVSTLHSCKKNTSSFEKSDFVITVSDKIGEHLKTKNRKTVYNGIDMQNIQKIDLYKKFNIPKESFIVCSVGRFVKAKRFDILINAFKLLNSHFHLILIGCGDDELEKKAKQENNITVTGCIDNIRTKEILKSSNLCAISSHREGFSYVFAESLMLETPLVSTDVADIKKFIPNKFIAKLKAKDIANKIESFYSKKEKNLALYKDIFSLAKEKFSIDDMTNNTLKIYKKVLSCI